MTKAIRYQPLSSIPLSFYIELHGNPQVLRHLPLAPGGFDELACQRWLAAKEQLWVSAGYAPQAVIVDGEFAGWAGLQPELGEAALAIVLTPKHWGIGLAVARQLLDRAFTALKLSSVCVLLPPSRTRVGALQRFGFELLGDVDYDGSVFKHYRLARQRYFQLNNS
ncbi:GNAT family N-acetyltransferase [Gilvimarinus sp. SDUM040013]|uniref:GNAT family N-acetyltransferase n=1 Tax=Gilvimarinus gilvus TaxID=3058038 RepID=A0ABU4RSB7_9GAMM|nr:GNAT family N-acetyltransferase [Gilvimarinus sp. SDUM040013]MDO3388230.1 GNAT family N-acetyltransferase [Gilvimarinus sp. SDUM040013]MDX6847780.1 GNAT family N-acetyltransferase [Gilvimarinus sp. SDUM040013]